VCVSAAGRRLLRAVICGAVAAPRAAEAFGEGVRVRGRAARLRRGPVEAGGCACRRPGAVCCAPSFAVRSPRRVRPRRLGRVCASAVARRVCVAVPSRRAGVRVGGRAPSVARRHLRCGRRAACGRGVWGGCARPRSRCACCVAVPLRRAVKWLGGGGSGGGGAVVVGIRSRCRVRSRRWGRAGASVGARCLLPRGRGAAGGQVVWRGQTRRQDCGVCRRTDAASRAPEASRGVRRVGSRAASAAARPRRCVRPSRRVGAVAAVVARRHLRCVRRAACGRGVGSACCVAVPLRRAVKWLGCGGRGGGCATFFGARSRCRVRPSRLGREGASAVAQRLSPHGRARRAVQSWGGQTHRRATFVGARSRCRAWSSGWASADAAVVARRHLRCGRRAACGRGVGGGCACRRSGGVCCRAVWVV